MSFQQQLDEFTRTVDAAQWFMGVSENQEKIIYSLHKVLRDDFDQETGTNMFKALSSLGIQPVIAPRQIKRIVQLSRNNILAFLVFIFEGYYKTCHKNDEYSINEQLLMIAIAKIDILPTLRGLDAILPPPRLHPHEIRRLNCAAQAQLNAQVQSKISPVAVQTPAKKSSKKSPYFQSQPKPVQRVSKFTTDFPDFTVEFKYWPRNGSPDYGEEGDIPWFAQYQLNPAQRLIKNTLSETLERYFQLASVEGTKDEDGAKSSESDVNMCLYHKAQVVQAQLLRDELLVKARDRCQELMDISQPYTKLRKARIVAQLEHDIDLVMDRHRRAMKCDQTKVLTLENADCVLCQKMLVSQPWPEPDDIVGRALVGEEGSMAHTAAFDTYCGRRLEGGGVKPNPNDEGKKKKKKAKAPPEPPPEEPKKIVSKRKPPPTKLRNDPLRISKIDFKENLGSNAHTAGIDTNFGRRLEGGGGKPKKNPKDKGKAKKKKAKAPPEPPEEPKKKVTPWKPPPPKLTNEPFRITKIDFKEKLEKSIEPQAITECDVPPAPKKSAVFFAMAAGKIPKKNLKCAMLAVAKRRKKKKFFKAAKSNKPYYFKYHRIFQSGLPKPFDLKGTVAKTFVKALNKPKSEDPEEQLILESLMEENQPPVGDATEPEPVKEPEPEMLIDPLNEEPSEGDSLESFSNHSRRSHIDHKAEIVEAVVRCANIIWQNQVAIKRVQMEREEQLTELNAPTFKEDEIYDPDDEEQMSRLLKDGLKVLRQDLRYVLASMPNAHKLPSMRMWIKRRYGKAYTQKELDANLIKCTRIFELVTLVQGNVQPVDLKGLDRMSRSQEHFGNYEQVKKTASAVKKEYQTKLNGRYLTDMGAAWYAMGNHLVPSGPPRGVFFSYINSNPKDILRAKTWGGTFRNIRSMREKRIKQERLAMGKKDD